MTKVYGADCRSCPIAEHKLGCTTYEFCNKSLLEHDAQIRADAINELKSKKDEIIKWLIKRDKEGYGTTNGELLDHIIDIAEKLKEQTI